jgi:hypothetical protein
MASVVDVSQVEALAQDYMTASGRVGRAGREALAEQAGEVHDIQVAHVRATANPTGDLESHLIINARGDGRASSMSVWVGSDGGEQNGHGAFLEEGTSRMPAQPWNEPAAAAAEKSWPDRTEALMTEITDGL